MIRTNNKYQNKKISKLIKKFKNNTKAKGVKTNLTTKINMKAKNQKNINFKKNTVFA